MDVRPRKVRGNGIKRTRRCYGELCSIDLDASVARRRGSSCSGRRCGMNESRTVIESRPRMSAADIETDGRNADDRGWSKVEKVQGGGCQGVRGGFCWRVCVCVGRGGVQGFECPETREREGKMTTRATSGALEGKCGARRRLRKQLHLVQSGRNGKSRTDMLSIGRSVIASTAARAQSNRQRNCSFTFLNTLEEYALDARAANLHKQDGKQPSPCSRIQPHRCITAM